MLYAILKPIVVVLLRLLFRVDAHGIERVPGAGPVLLVANHSSLLDPPLCGAVLPRQISFLAKAELFRIPLFGWLLRRLNARPVRREGSDAGALRESLRVLGEDRALLVFPEGTRGPDDRLRPFKSGAGMLAVLSGATVVPVRVSGSWRAWPKGRRLPRPTKITVTFGPPLRFERRDDVDRKEQYEAASRVMTDALARLMDTSIPPTGAEPPRSGQGDEFEAVGGASGYARIPTTSTHGRKGQHGQA